MFNLPPPPRFTLPPPPMPSSDIIDEKLLLQLTCSSIRQSQPKYYQITDFRLIIISCISFFTAILIFILLFIILQNYRRQKSSFKSNGIKSRKYISDCNSSLNPSRSYETISSRHTGIYVESVDTSETTYSTDPGNTICHHCLEEHDYSSVYLPPYYHTLDAVSS